MTCAISRWSDFFVSTVRVTHYLNLYSGPSSLLPLSLGTSLPWDIIPCLHITFFFFKFYWDRVPLHSQVSFKLTLCSLGWSQSHNPPTSASWVVSYRGVPSLVAWVLLEHNLRPLAHVHSRLWSWSCNSVLPRSSEVKSKHKGSPHTTPPLSYFPSPWSSWTWSNFFPLEDKWTNITWYPSFSYNLFA